MRDCIHRIGKAQNKAFRAQRKGDGTVNRISLVSTLVVAVFIGIVALTAVAFEQGIIGIAFSEDQPNGNSCDNPSAEKVETCQKLEEQILASTVQIVIQTWVVGENESGYYLDESVGHATVMGNDHLVTHNHFSIPLSIRQQNGDAAAYGVVKLFDAHGQKLFESPLSEFELAQEELETLVFSLKNKGQFEALGLRPAAFKEWTSLPLQPGMEVAQIDWDGATTRVDWTKVQEVKLDDGVPRLVLDDGAMPGASGGGIFWQGNHVANNWRLEEMIEASGDVVDSVTTVALNSVEVVRWDGRPVGLFDHDPGLQDR